MTQPRAQLAHIDTPLWFCLKVQAKREHLAAVGLRRQLQISCFSPRLRYRKLTRRGIIWFVEAMFPGYLFAEFIYAKEHRRIEHSPGVLNIVQFGDELATVDSQTIQVLRRGDDEEVITVDPELREGQGVKIAGGPFQGLEAIVTRVMPASERIRVLLEFLGRKVETELTRPQLLSLERPRLEDEAPIGPHRDTKNV